MIGAHMETASAMGPAGGAGPYRRHERRRGVGARAKRVRGDEGGGWEADVAEESWWVQGVGRPCDPGLDSGVALAVGRMVGLAPEMSVRQL